MKKLLNKFIEALDNKADKVPEGWYSAEDISKHLKLGKYQAIVKLHDGVNKGTILMKKFRLKNNINRFYWANFYKTK